MSSRMSALNEDFDCIRNHCQALRNCPFKDFEKGENFCHFSFKDGIVEKEYKVHFSDEYPAMSLLTVTDKSRGRGNTTHSFQCSDRLPTLLTKLAKEMHITLDIRPPRNERNNNCDVEESDEMATDDEYEDYDDYYGTPDIYDESNAQAHEMHQQLEHDLEHARDLFGEAAIKCVLLDTIDQIDVEFVVPLDFLDVEIVRAWRLKEEPLLIKANFSLSRYLDGGKPPVKVVQPSQSKFGIGTQLEKILEAFLSAHWNHLSNDRVRKECKPVKKKEASPIHMPSSSDEDAPPTKSPPSSPSIIDDAALAHVVGMGFEPEMVRSALAITANDVTQAVDILVSSPERLQAEAFIHSNLEASAHSATGSSAGFHNPPSAPRHTATANVTSIVLPNKRKKNQKPTTRVTKHAASASKASNSSFVESMSNFIAKLLPSSLTAPKDPKSVPSLDHGFLVQLMQYIRQRVPTLNEYCVICDSRHLFQNGAMLKPAVCSGPLCVFSFQTLGVMSDAADDIATGPAVVDLLIAMANAACNSDRCQIIFEPYPTVVDPTKPTELAFNPAVKNIKKCRDVLEKFPKTAEMAKYDVSGLKKNMDAKHPLAYPLLQWIINSNRSHIVKLPEEKQMNFMNTKHQFLLMSSPPAKEAIFRAAKQKHGSIFAFHGSSLENWHSIMRQGLINASGTKYQMNGAAFGKGIYLSPKAMVSIGYCRSRGGVYRTANPPPKVDGSTKSDEKKQPSANFLKGNTLTCIALCEVVNSADLKKSSDIWVMSNDEHVCTRFFFVYEKGISVDSTIDCSSPEIKKEIEKAMSFSYR